MNSRLATLEINHLPKGGGQFDPPLPRAIRTTAFPGLQRWASAFQARIGASVVKEAVTTAADGQKTAARPAVECAHRNQPNMALTDWKARRVHKTDVVLARNALDADEVTQLNRIAAMCLDDAKDPASQRQDLRMDDWRQYVDRFVEFNERPLLKDAGTVSHERMQQIVDERYAAFDAKRRTTEALAADVEDIKALKPVEKSMRGASVCLDDWKLMQSQNRRGLHNTIKMSLVEMDIRPKYEKRVCNVA
ncbi:RhuM family protein [Xanthomonas campestris pv. incanae]|uniref:RhuM family protein n=1 Tax=Xanthomonas campestris TaxID=339 RepID=UPI003F4D129B